MAQLVKNLPTMWETWFRSLGWDDPLGKEMATYSSTLVWKITRMKEPGRLQSMGSQELETTEQLHYGPNVLGSYAILLFTASDFISITSHIHNWVLFLLLLCLFILSGVICPLISSSILDTYWSREFIFQCPIFLPFHTVRGVLKARILMWSAISFSSGPCFVRTLHRDLPVCLGWPYTAWVTVSLS